MQERNAPHMRVGECRRRDARVGRLRDDGKLSGGREIAVELCISLITVAERVAHSPLLPSLRGPDAQRRSPLRTCQSVGPQRSSSPLPVWPSHRAKPALWAPTSGKYPTAYARESDVELSSRLPTAIGQPAETVRPPPWLPS
jgi:hypothetical protein